MYLQMHLNGEDTFLCYLFFIALVQYLLFNQCMTPTAVATYTVSWCRVTLTLGKVPDIKSSLSYSLNQVSVLGLSALSAPEHLFFNLPHVTGSNEEEKKDCQKALSESVQFMLSPDCWWWWSGFYFISLLDINILLLLTYVQCRKELRVLLQGVCLGRLDTVYQDAAPKHLKNFFSYHSFLFHVFINIPSFPPQPS